MTPDERRTHLTVLRDDLAQALRQAEAELEPVASAYRRLDDCKRRLESQLAKTNEALQWLQPGNDPDPNSYPR